MIKRKMGLMLLLSLSFTVSASASDKVEVDGINYYLYTKGSVRTANVTSPMEGHYSGNIVIPSKVSYGGADYTVTEIEERTFTTEADLSAIATVDAATPVAFDVYTLRGMLVRRQTTTLQGLHRGLYIVNGKK